MISYKQKEVKNGANYQKRRCLFSWFSNGNSRHLFSRHNDAEYIPWGYQFRSCVNWWHDLSSLPRKQTDNAKTNIYLCVRCCLLLCFSGYCINSVGRAFSKPGFAFWVKDIYCRINCLRILAKYPQKAVRGNLRKIQKLDHGASPNTRFLFFAQYHTIYN